MSRSDDVLVSQTLAGDAAAYAELVARYRPRLGRYAYHMLGNRQDAEEALQDAFLRAYRFLARCADPARFGPWLFAILANRCRTVRSRRARIRASQESLSPNLSAGGDSAEQLAWRDAIEHALARLRMDQREAFLLKYVEGYSYEEMARLTGVTESALRMRVKRASDRLRAMLQDVHHG